MRKFINKYNQYIKPVLYIALIVIFFVTFITINKASTMLFYLFGLMAISLIVSNNAYQLNQRNLYYLNSFGVTTKKAKKMNLYNSLNSYLLLIMIFVFHNIILYLHSRIIFTEFINPIYLLSATIFFWLLREIGVLLSRVNCNFTLYVILKLLLVMIFVLEEIYLFIDYLLYVLILSFLLLVTVLINKVKDYISYNKVINQN